MSVDKPSDRLNREAARMFSLARVKRKPVWTIVVDASLQCPSCGSDMETVMRFHPVNGRVAGCTRTELQYKEMSFWFDNSAKTEDVCPGCGYTETDRC